MKILYYDLETTGLLPNKNSIHQIGYIFEIDDEIVEQGNILMQPNPKAEISLEALKVANKTLEDLAGYQSFNDGYKEFSSMLKRHIDPFDKTDKAFLCGFNNAAFDNQFLRGLFLQNNDQYFGSMFWSSTLDVMVLATQALIHQRHEMPNFKLKTVAKWVGLNVDENLLHDAMYDIQLTRDIYKLIG